MRTFYVSIAFLLALSACSTQQESAEEIQQTQTAEIENPTNQVKLVSDVEWEQLNPARGDQSPKAGTVWGDRKDTVPTGFLAEFVDGFSSPPHIHNVTYRAVVINGLVHNDDPAAAKMWMPSGSFWTQPVGEAHITAVKGSKNIAYVENDKGPYLVHPINEAFDSGERPVNIDAANVVWSEESADGVKKAYLWGSPLKGELYGSFLKLPAGYDGTITSDGEVFRAIVIQGSPLYQLPGEATPSVLDPGSSFSSKGDALHSISTDAETLIYVRTNGLVD